MSVFKLKFTVSMSVRSLLHLKKKSNKKKNVNIMKKMKIQEIIISSQTCHQKKKKILVLNKKIMASKSFTLTW